MQLEIKDAVEEPEDGIIEPTIVNEENLANLNIATSKLRTNT